MSGQGGWLLPDDPALPPPTLSTHVPRLSLRRDNALAEGLKMRNLLAELAPEVHGE